MGCGYRYEGALGPFGGEYTLFVPYVGGDREGILTDELVKAITLSSRFTYARQGALTLQGKIIDDQQESIGWQYEHVPKTGSRLNQLTPSEERREVAAEFVLISSRTGKVVYGPFIVKAHSDYDFIDPDSPLDTSFETKTARRFSTLSFSLGQLSSMQDARSAALKPIYRALAHKVIAGIERISLDAD